ncbi:MAG: uroporphyrinogen-III C-methyltransferase, partial [Deltaproteobacteria bacterium]|nr:uroporphyrinogen-III C-methyltransferase [Deltaproteobacteria bacterium]
MTSPKDKQTSLPGKQGGQNTPGTVYLVGAGPGHPGLLTRRGAEILGFAQVVAYDRLVSPEVLALASPQAEMIVVGRRQGQDPGVPGMHPIVLEKSLQGLSVARLKSGDPFIFGRGAEELDDLLSAHIPFEVVPGVSAALGAAAYAGIPLTHRKLASDVTLVTGHDGESGLSSQAQWDHLARGTGTLVLYMAARRLGPNVRRLIQAGR